MTGDAGHLAQVQTPEASAPLCELLAAQIACARDGKLARLEQLSAEATVTVTRMKETGADRCLTESQRGRLKELYGDLVLALQAQCADTKATLRQLRQVRRALRAYGGKAITMIPAAPGPPAGARHPGASRKERTR